MHTLLWYILVWCLQVCEDVFAVVCEGNCDAPRAQRGASRKQTTTRETGGFVLPGRVKQRKHESADVFFCEPEQSTGVSKQAIRFFIFGLYRFIPVYKTGMNRYLPVENAENKYITNT